MVPRVRVGHARAVVPPERVESIAQGFRRSPDGGTGPRRGWSRGRDSARSWAVRTERASGDPLVDSATDHAAAGRHRAVLRTSLRAPVRSAVPDPTPAGPAAASDRARDGGANGWPRPTGRSSRTGSSSTSTRPTSRGSERWSSRSPPSSPTRPCSFARAHHYTLVDRPRVDLLADPTVERSDIRVDARFADPIAGRRGRRARTATGPDPQVRDPGDDPLATMVFAVPRPAAPKARLRVHDPDGGDPGRGYRGGPDDRPCHRQRPGRCATSGCRGTTDGSPAGAARSSTPISAARTGRGSTGTGSPRSCWASATGIRLGDTTLEVEVDEAPD